jgi:gamma-glutamyltranspeptidase/glutathione hydrolase
MSPTLVMKDDRPCAILGAPGGSKIITVVAQTLIGLTRFDLSADELCRQPRFHHQWLPDVLYLEEESFSDTLSARLRSFGHSVKQRSHYSDLQIICIDEEGRMTPASDPRGRGLGGGH